MYIETKRLIVRDFNENDVNALYRIKNDEQVLKFAPDFLEVKLDPADTINHINHFNQLENDGDIDTWRCYAIEHKQTHEVMGCLCFCKEDMLFEYHPFSKNHRRNLFCRPRTDIQCTAFGYRSLSKPIRRPMLVAV